MLRITSKPNKSKAKLSLLDFGFPGSLLQCDGHNAEHVVPWRRFAGPYLKLTGRLVDEHFDAWDDLGSARLGQLYKSRLGRVVDHFEDVAGVDLVLIQGRLA